MMDKTNLLQLITEKLDHDLAIQFNAAKTAHAASTHEENIPDNKYETLALEASYVAQGQANRAQEIKQALEIYKQLPLQRFDNDSAIRLTALITLSGSDNSTRTLFLGPIEGGLKVCYQQTEIVVITPASPLGRELLGKSVGDSVSIMVGSGSQEFEIVGIC